MKIASFKKLILTLSLVILGSICSANVLPVDSTDIPRDTIGVYQTDDRITIHIKPDFGANIIIDKKINYSDYNSEKADNMFAIIVPNKKLGYLYATDISDDEQWVKVIYDKTKNSTGWVYKNDDFQFMTWMDFLSLYGRKYGLKRLKSGSHDDELYSNPTKDAQVIGKVSNPKLIRMSAIEGNWMLVTILDYTNSTITGYTNWRTNLGEILLFPEIK